MREILPAVTAWAARGVPFALATVVATRQSAPREPGAAMAVSAADEVVGSVSGGCVEAVVHHLCTSAIAAGEPVREEFGVADDDVFAVGLTCGGTVEVLVVPVLPGSAEARVLQRLGELTEAGVPAVLGTGIAGPHLGAMALVTADGADRGAHAVVGEGWATRLSERLVEDLRALVVSGGTSTLRYDEQGCRAPNAGEDAAAAVLAQSFAPPPRLLVFGAVDFTAALVVAGKLLGYRVTVCDARPAFTTPARFPGADEVVVARPHEYLAATAVDARTAICVLTHDPKFDIPVLREALCGPAGYVGAMGSRRTHAERVEGLRAAGVSAEQLERLHSPIGLDLGGRTPQETAIAIAAEIVSVRRGGTGAPLSTTSGRIHGDLPGDASGDVPDDVLTGTRG